MSVQSRIPEADGIRGLACLIVLLVHAVALTFPSTYPYLQGVGKIGVWLFFSLSSYLLTHQLLYRGFSTRTLIDYSIGRVVRIYPLYVVVVIICYSMGSAGIDSYEDVIKAITFQQGYAHLWTIPVEFKSYIALPIIILCGLAIHSRYGWMGIGIAGFLFTFAHQLWMPYWQLEENSIDTIPYLPAFVVGAIGAIIKSKESFPWISEKSSIIGCVIIVGILLVTPFSRYFILGVAPSDYLMNKYLFFSAAWTIFIFTQHNSRGFIGKILISPLLAKIGLCSYSIYLIHVLVISRVTMYYPERLDAAAAMIGFSILAGYLMYTVFETPLLNVRKRVRSLLMDGQLVRS